MCSICGCYAYSGNMRGINEDTVKQMSATMKARGPDGSGTYSGEDIVLAHNRLAVIDPEGGAQPMRISFGKRSFVIVYNGEIYNTAELKKRLELLGAVFHTRCDTEVVLWSYILYNEECVRLLNGIFAFAVYNESEDRLFIARDRLGVKPLYYTSCGGVLAFASECKALLELPGVSRKVDRRGLWQLLFLAPATVPGSGIFRDINELEGGMCITADKNGFRCRRYWQLCARPFTGGRDDATKEVSGLLTDAVRRQLISDVPLCTFLSGGLDSSAITAIAARELAGKGEKLSSYSFEYEGNGGCFESSLFQPESDDSYAALAAEHTGTAHTVLTVSDAEVAQALEGAVRARDMPGQADIDSSLYLYCERVKKKHTVALSGECSDEIFGGYPWFYREEMLERPFFPWIHNPFARASLFRREAVCPDEGYDWLSEIYRSTVKDTEILDTDSPEMISSRRATVLSARFYMAHLLARKDRMSMAHSLEVRVPFADHRIIEYVYNVPWSIKFAGGVEKSLLREAVGLSGLLPDSILYRKKSPYPKIYTPGYEKLVSEKLMTAAGRGLFGELADKNAVNALINGGEGGTWYGQLMAKPQLLAWLYQLAFWLEEYRVELVT